MSRFIVDRYAIFVIAEGGKIVSESYFDNPVEAREALNAVARDAPGAARVVLIDRQDGRIMGDLSRGAPTRD